MDKLWSFDHSFDQFFTKPRQAMTEHSSSGDTLTSTSGWQFRLSAMALGTLLGLGPVAMASAAPDAQTSARSLVVPIARLTNQGPGAALGQLTFRSLAGGGLELIPDLRQLPPGANGFHLHEHPDCGPGRVDGRVVAGGAAGGHWDPTGTLGSHGHGTSQDSTGQSAHHGHTGSLPLGDLPPLVVNANGQANSPVRLGQFKDLAMIRGRSILIHQGLHGPRFACGVIPAH